MNRYCLAIALLAGMVVLPVAAEGSGRKQKLMLSISLPSRKVTIGEALAVEIRIKNVSSDTVEFTYFKPHFWTPRIINSETGEKLLFNAEIVTETNIPVEKIHRRLAAGEMATEKSFPLYVFDRVSKENLTYIVVNPGKYKVQLDIRLEKNSPKDWEGMLTSNRIPIEIVASSSAALAKLKLVIPQDNWKPIFFAEINKRARVAHLRDLRSLVLPKNDLEIRVWIGFGLWALEGLVIRRDAGRWSAVNLESIVPNHLPQSDYQKVLQNPKSGWEKFWKRIIDEGVLTLPDASELKNEKLIEDGTSFVVETNMNGIYRTYHYNNPDYQDFEQAKGMIKISNIFAEEFNLEDFKFERQKP